VGLTSQAGEGHLREARRLTEVQKEDLCPGQLPPSSAACSEGGLGVLSCTHSPASKACDLEPQQVTACGSESTSALQT
jgi:hypothetical protein